MIGNTTRGHSDFGSALGYITKKEKCESIEGYNLTGWSLQAAIAEMQAEVRAANSGRPDPQKIQTPVYHTSISWAEGDHPTLEEKMQVGRDYLRHMGLGDHQAFVASHDDEPQDHIHIVASRLHPTTGELWERFDYSDKDRRLNQTHHERQEEFLRAQERAHGWQVTPGRFYGQWEKTFDGRTSLTQSEYHEQQRAGRAADALGMPAADTRAVLTRANELTDELYGAKSFEEFDQVLAKNGLWIASKGQGAVITDGSEEVKASDVSRGLSGPRLQERFGEKLKDYEQAREAKIDGQAGQKAARHIMTSHREKVGDAVAEEAYSRAKAREGRLSSLEHAAHLGRQRLEFREAIATTFEKPGKVLEKFRARAKKVGASQAAKDVLADPGKYAGQFKGKTGYKTARYSSSRQVMNQQFYKALWGKLQSEGQHMSIRAMYQSEGGQAVAKTSANLISVSRAIKQMVATANEGPSLRPALELLAKAKGALRHEGGQATGQILQAATSGTGVGKDLLTNPRKAGAKSLYRVISGVRRAGGRAAELSTGPKL